MEDEILFKSETSYAAARGREVVDFNTQKGMKWSFMFHPDCEVRQSVMLCSVLLKLSTRKNGEHNEQNCP